MFGFSSGEAARALGVGQSALLGNIKRAGCPDASLRVGGKRVFLPADVAAVRRWYQATGKKVNAFDERDYEPARA